MAAPGEEESMAGEGHLRVEDDLGDGFFRLCSSEAERRQAAHDIRSTEDIVIELLRNARDADARTIFLAVTREEGMRRLVAIDDGVGVPAHLHERIFEPRVTSKLDTMRMDKWGVHGRGMALYSIAVNSSRARVMASEPGKGTAILVETDLEKLGEKADQSTFPDFELNDAGAVSVRGPRNILRTACEFALDSNDECTLFLGSATEIAATLYALGLSALTASIRAFCTDSSELPVTRRLAVAPDAAALARETSLLGLDLSERSARRILDGQIAPLKPLVNRIRIKGLDDRTESASKPQRRRQDPFADARGLKVDPADLAAFSERVKSAFSDLARAYYLEEDVEPQVRVERDAIRVVIPCERLR